ncbi:hypothetical protein [Actinocrispum wychmicini]|uniref:hypothetical protein n=1 Tax=Actinocrispum wychmicini TaxID=1213861 RepID=UPI0010528E71|nr:hypothetical protein [Actinocrispum wychmicini]
MIDVEIDDESVQLCESDPDELCRYLDNDGSLWNDALRWETVEILENEISDVEIVGLDTPLT